MALIGGGGKSDESSLTVPRGCCLSERDNGPREDIDAPQMEADRKSTRHDQSRGKKGMTMNKGGPRALRQPRVARREDVYN